MATTKKRINISLGKETETALKQIAERDKVPVATKAEEMVRLALELEEDIVLGALAKKRDTKNAHYLASDEVWQ
jgi:hypothetical protein